MLRKFTAISALVAAALSVGGADAKHFHIKVFSEKAATVTAADTMASSGSSSTGVSAGDSSNPNTWHMKQVTSIQARVQGDAPVWDDTAKAYLSKYGSTTAEKYRSVLDTVNTASVEGALMYVQAEGINVKEQSVKCQRKNNMQYVVFYEMTIVQPTYAIAAYQSNDPVEYTPFLAMDGAKCTDEGSDLPKACKQLYGLDGELDLGASVGAQLKASDPRAPYPGNYWFSFPNSCADKLRADKTDSCRAEHAGGLCPMGVTPDGEQCSFSYKILGYLNIDDLVGITSLKGSNGKVYSNYTEFCNDGGIEFDATNTGSGFTVKESLPFWENPGNETANTERFEKMVALFNKEAPNAKVGTMTPLPEITDLVKANPKCYENSEQCAKAKNGCRRTLYSQVCEVCSGAGDGCEVAPSSFTYPTLIAATPAPGVSSGSGSGSGINSDDAGTTSSAMTASSAFASVALAFSVALAALLAELPKVHVAQFRAVQAAVFHDPHDHVAAARGTHMEELNGVRRRAAASNGRYEREVEPFGDRDGIRVVQHYVPEAEQHMADDRPRPPLHVAQNASTSSMWHGGVAMDAATIVADSSVRCLSIAGHDNTSGTRLNVRTTSLSARSDVTLPLMHSAALVVKKSMTRSCSYLAALNAVGMRPSSFCFSTSAVSFGSQSGVYDAVLTPLCEPNETAEVEKQKLDERRGHDEPGLAQRLLFALERAPEREKHRENAFEPQDEHERQQLKPARARETPDANLLPVVVGTSSETIEMLERNVLRSYAQRTTRVVTVSKRKSPYRKPFEITTHATSWVVSVTLSLSPHVSTNGRSI